MQLKFKLKWTQKQNVTVYFYFSFLHFLFIKIVSWKNIMVWKQHWKQMFLEHQNSMLKIIPVAMAAEYLALPSQE